nr:MAG TPA: MraZ protein [Caudoviricetes sp.]
MQINDKEQITIPSDWCGIVKILFDGYFWNLYKY